MYILKSGLVEIKFKKKKKDTGVRETDNANNFYSKPDCDSLLLTSIDSVAEHCGNTLIGFSKFLFLW